MRRLIRYSSWRLAFVAAFLPYTLAAVLADFVHVHSPQDGRAPLALFATVGAKPSTTPPADGTDLSCPACAWLRIGHRAEMRVSIGVATHGLTTPIRLLESEWPDSPVPHQPALRGPPAPIFS